MGPVHYRKLYKKLSVAHAHLFGGNYISACKLSKKDKYSYILDN